MSLFIANNKMMSINGIPLVMPNVEAFTFKVDTTKGNALTSFKIPTVSGYTTKFGYRINGIGQWTYVTAWNQAETLISLPSAGVHTIEMIGESAWSFNNTGDKDKLGEILKWGNFKFNYLTYGFYGCSNIKLPAIGSINGSTLTSLNYCFAGCNLQDIGSSAIFNNCKNITSFSATFYLNRLASIPAGLFDNCSLVTNFQTTFATNKLTSIPVDLFKYNINVTNFQSTFYQNQLTSIPSGLFDYCTLVTNFYGTFSTNQLTSIPVDLFKYNINVTNFATTFSTNLITSIPAGLFDNCTLVTTFYLTFYKNQLTSIPVDLFKYNINVTNFAATFSTNQLTSIPANLFDNCPLVTNFYGTFYSNQLTSIPNRLFYYNRNVTDYNWVFNIGIASGCTLPPEIFYMDATTLNKVTNWSAAFNCYTTTKSPLGTVQDIWNYASGSSVKTDCFQNCTALSNYASIPVEWI